MVWCISRRIASYRQAETLSGVLCWSVVSMVKVDERVADEMVSDFGEDWHRQPRLALSPEDTNITMWRPPCSIN
jgi:hypothetical protein